MSASNWDLERVKGRNVRVLGPVEEAMREQMERANAKRDTAHLHPSEMSKDNWCIRQTWYKMNQVEQSNPEHLNLRRINILAEGNRIHDKWQAWLWKAGLLAGTFFCDECGSKFEALAPTQCHECFEEGHLYYREVPIKQDSIKMIGHADGEIRDTEGEALLEIKSVGVGTIRWDAPKLYEAYESGKLSLDDLWGRIKRPLTTHLRQISLYMWATGIYDAVVIYEWKPTQEVKEFHVQFDYEVIREIVEKAEEYWSYVEDDVIPPPIDGAKKSKPPCVWCPWKTECLG